MTRATLMSGVSNAGFNADVNSMMEPPSPLEIILREIENAIDFRLHYLGLHLSLSIPDICSSLEVRLDSNKPWRGVEERYKGWCVKYFKSKYRDFTAEDCWALRGGVIHNGMLSGHPKARFTRVTFTIPDGTLTTIKEFVSEIRDPFGNDIKTLSLDLPIFCHLMAQAAREWYSAMKNDDVVKENIPNLVRLRPTGLPPHIEGKAVIA